MYEIEQKFIYDELPKDSLKLIQHAVIYRQYLSSYPEVRINRKVYDSGEERYTLALKSDDYLKRKEVIIMLTKEQYDGILSINNCNDLILDVYDYSIDASHRIQFKECRNMDICFAEISYMDMADYSNMQGLISKYSFLKEEVTNDDRYYVKNIWKRFCRKE